MPRRIYVGSCTEIVTRLDDVEMVLDRDSVNWAQPRSPRSLKEGDS